MVLAAPEAYALFLGGDGGSGSGRVEGVQKVAAAFFGRAVKHVRLLFGGTFFRSWYLPTVGEKHSVNSSHGNGRSVRQRRKCLTGACFFIILPLLAVVSCRGMQKCSDDRNVWQD